MNVPEVDEWLWVSSALSFDPRPLFNERCGLRTPARPSQAPPDPPVGGVAYGVVGDGEVMLVRLYDAEGVVSEEADASFDAGRKVWRTYRRHGSSGMEFVATYTLEYDAGGAHARTICDSSVLREVETYERDVQGRIVRITVEREGAGVFPDDPSREEYVVTYNETDEPLTVTEIAVPGGIVLDRTARAIARELEYLADELVHRIRDAVERIGGAEPVRCVVLSCESGGRALPLIGIGVISERELTPEPWNPADFRHALGISEPFQPRDSAKFSAACAALERTWATLDDDDAPLRLARSVAHQLNARSWPAEFVSEEFVAIAVEESLDDFVEQARLSAPAEKVEPIIARYVRFGSAAPHPRPDVPE